MATTQGATLPGWRGRTRRRLLADVLGGLRQNWDKLIQLLGLVAGYVWPPIVRRRLERLRALGHIDVVPTTAQLLVAGRDQMMVSAVEETKVFYASQAIPWGFHNMRRFLSGPATVLDPIGLFSPRDAIIHHVLQTFHRHPVYDLVLLRAHEQGVEAMAAQADQLLAGTHPHQRALTSLIEDGAYHARLPQDIAAFAADPHVAARAIPGGLVKEANLMLAMDQFKDVRGYTRYAARLPVGMMGALWAWLLVGFDESIGGMLHIKLGPRRIRAEACDPDIRDRHPGA